MSAAVHATAAVTIGGVLTFAPGAAPDPIAEPASVDVTVMSLADRPLPQSAPAAAVPTHAPVATHRRVVGRAAAATPQPPAVAQLSPPAPASPADEPRPMFALSAGTVASGPSLAMPPAASPGPSHGLTTRTSTAGGGTNAVDTAAAVGERDVDIPARLLAAAPLAYPPAARNAGIELDFPLEIVVDARGQVISARALTHAGYGLDEAALQGIRGYRFSPAMHAGGPVAVRMRWVVQFQLR